VIGAGVVLAAAGWGHRRIAARLGRAADTVRGWVRRARGSAEALRLGFTELLVAVDPDPVVPDLNALTPERRSQFLLDMSRLGDALLRVASPVRINYAIFGNLEPALHAHVVPRYRSEPEAMQTQHPWAYKWDDAPEFDATTAAPLMRSLRTELAQLGTLRTP